MQSSAMHAAMTIRTMAPEDVGLALDWAAAEGWNPGLSDASPFAAVDPGGFLIGEVDGAPAAIVSCVNYDERFAFLGFYIVRPDLRGRGYGRQIWQAAVARAGTRLIGLDGVVAQQDNYRRSGFVLAHANVRYGGAPAPAAGMRSVPTVPLASVAAGLVEASEAAVFPAPRPDFLRRWIHAPGHHGRAVLRDGDLAAWGVIRPCREGRKIGPLVAADRAAAEAVLDDLLDVPAEGPVFLDVPATNGEAVRLAEARGLATVFETARMYTGPAPPIRTDRIFGVTTFELG